MCGGLCERDSGGVLRWGPWLPSTSHQGQGLCQKIKTTIAQIGGGLVATSCPTLATPGTVARWAPLSVGFPRQDYCSGLPFPSAGDLPHPGIEPRSPTLQAGSLPTEPSGKPMA